MAKSVSNGEASSSNKKFVLSKGMKTELLTMGTFIEELAEAIVQETQSRLPQNF